MSQFVPGSVRFGIVTNLWNNDDLPRSADTIPYRQVLSEVALAGYDGCSLGGNFPKDTAVLREDLTSRGLTISEPWVGTYFTCSGMRQRTIDDFLAQLAVLRELGGTDIVVAELGHAVHLKPIALAANRVVFDDRQWQALLSGMDELGTLATDAGVRLCYHHHMGTGVQNRADVDRLMAGTDPAKVHLLLDTGHATWAGDDPVALIRDHITRIGHVHLKSVRRDVLNAHRDASFLDAVQAGAFTIPGDGCVDFPAILSTLADAGYTGWLVVEAEEGPGPAIDPYTTAARARRYLRKLTSL
ncbi:myo-inosose-2 dehydratase [Streptomyces sp. NPDC007205]|uniref:myo-inosose-2 dehydratase n=1 Tax=Streptomyces sp. NPDC007205 TaxID=3154316 RepID=UPI0034007313